jgi:hypothetical protein
MAAEFQDRSVAQIGRSERRGKNTMTHGPDELIDQVSSVADLVRFIQAVRKELLESPEKWENQTLPDYLDAMAAWLNDSHANKSSPGYTILNEQPSWQTFARILLMPSVYE